MPHPTDYIERVYAGVLGKIIGVYLGRPFEGWTYDRIMAELGEVNYYVHEKRSTPLVVTDDDISGTFTFLRAMEDYGCSQDLTAEQIGQTWLNYLIEKRTVLWWGGMGNSTEHTAYLRLKHGMKAPESGSIAANGKVVAEQIGAQIFIDGWGMIAPGDPELAAEFARKAASVSHDGEAIHGAQVVAAMEAQAFVEQDIQALLDVATGLIPKDSLIYRMIADLREWHAGEKDWRANREKIVTRYGYDKYGGNCHMVPNHALIIHALLHGDGDFQKSLMIVNTCGWDTDCNSGNVGCLMGIRNGLAGSDSGPDWRGPVADRLYLPTADGGRCITDAAAETYRIVNIARALAGLKPEAPKNGSRYHFELPGSVQGFVPEDSVETRGTATAENVGGGSHGGSRRLAIRFHHVATGRAARVATATFTPPSALKMGGYSLYACPTLYSGQTVRALLEADPNNDREVACSLYLRVYNRDDSLAVLYGPSAALQPGAHFPIVWQAPDTHGYPIAEIGIEITSQHRADGALYLDYLTWDGAPNVTLSRTDGGSVWRRAWVDGVDHYEGGSPGEPFRLIQDEGIGLLIQGCREWKDYRLSAAITPHMAESAGIAARVQGLRRYYALLLCRGNKVRIVKALDGLTTLAESPFPWEFGTQYELSMTVTANRVRASIDGHNLFDFTDTDCPLTEGAIAFVIEEGRLRAEYAAIEPS
jgi:ADP-ribosylglycohydrolase